jgi:Uma2 family endonuclease
MNTPVRWSSKDLELLPEKNVTYEIVDGELFVAKQPHWHHQMACTQILTQLHSWSRQTGQGAAVVAPGVIFDDENDVAPDVVWVSRQRLDALLGDDGHLHGAPELVVEVLSPGATNERRDRVAKLKLYGLRGVQEYWLADWRVRTVEVHRRQEGTLQLVGVFLAQDDLSSPLLPGFRVKVSECFPSPLGRDADA